MELEKICNLYGTSGDEEQVRKYIISKISAKCYYTVDNLGNILVHKKGKKKPAKKILFSAHMDEVGLIVTGINSDGTVNFDSVGGVNANVVIGRQVYFKRANIYGVCGAKPIHRLERNEREIPPKFNDLYIDIGTVSKVETEKIIELGDTIYFTADFINLGEDKICSKAIDDRAGCQILIDMINSDLKYDIDFMFCVQEEIGCRGSAAGSYTLDPDIAVIIETTTAQDIDGVDNKVCSLGDGAVISYMDRGTIYDRDLYNIATSKADKENIKWQTKTKIAGGNDSRSIQRARGGVKVLAISIPCRYLHSPSVVMDINDYKAVRNLAFALCEELGK